MPSRTRKNEVATQQKRPSRPKTTTGRTKSRPRASKEESVSRAAHAITSDDVKGCTSSLELSELIESAFATWSNPDAKSTAGKRKTPRIKVKTAKTLFVVSYTHDHEEKHLNAQAELADISADGLGIVMPKAIPVGATVRFALAGENGEPVFGYGSVARTTRRTRKHWIGLTFMDCADSLNIAESAKESDRPASDSNAPVKFFGQLGQRVAIAARRVLGGFTTVRTITRCDQEKRATFLVEARLLRYRATLDVDGKQVAFASWPLDGGPRKLSLAEPQPTVVQLEGDGFRATATVQPSAILSCDLEIGSETSGQRFLVAPQRDPAMFNIELGPPRGNV